MLASLFRTEPDHPPQSGYQRLVFDLSALAGRTILLRFAASTNVSFLLLGVDNVRLLAVGVP
ncbi:MAG: hypothetical protein AB7N91_25150 [Candidatus Tectimicrobiota bacterium]